MPENRYLFPPESISHIEVGDIIQDLEVREVDRVLGTITFAPALSGSACSLLASTLTTKTISSPEGENMSTGYELLKEDSIVVDGHTLYRIKDIASSCLGGYIESEKNLLSGGGGWIDEPSRIYGDIIIGKDTNICRSTISGSGRIENTSIIDTRVHGHMDMINSRIDESDISGNLTVTGSSISECNIKGVYRFLGSRFHLSNISKKFLSVKSLIRLKVRGAGKPVKFTDNVFRQYKMKGSVSKSKSPKYLNKKQKHIGIELEFLSSLNVEKLTDEAVKLLPSKFLNKLTIGGDGSISGEDYGIEVRLLTTAGSYKKDISTFCRFLGYLRSMEHTFEVNKSCGFHVHLDQRGRSMEGVSGAYNNLVNSLPFLTSIVSPSRLKNQYCLNNLEHHEGDEDNSAVKSYEALPDDIYNTFSQFLSGDISSQELKKEAENSDHTRYLMINFNSLLKYKTLEVRLHQGMLERDRIINWINILLLINNYDTGLEWDQPEDIIKSLYLKIKTARERKEFLEYLIERIGKFSPKLLPKLQVLIDDLQNKKLAA